MNIELSVKNIVIFLGIISAGIGNVFFVGKLFSDFELLKTEIQDIKGNQNVLELQQEINIEDVLALLIQNLKSLFSSLKESRDLSEEYLKYLIGYKQGIQIMHEGQLLEGEISSLRDDGCIVFTTEQGISTFCSGEINFLRSSF